MAKKKTPVNDTNLAGGSFTGVDEVSNFGDRLARYGQARSRALGMLGHLRSNPTSEAPKAAAGLAGCGNYLHFREYYTVDKVRLHNAQFCKQHLICPLCAIRRGAKALGAYLARWEVIRTERPDLRPYLVTFTVKNGDDLQERQTHLTKSLRKLMDHRRNFNAGVPRAPWTELCKAEGAVYTLELTNKGNGWHPHCHMIVLAASEPSQGALSIEWDSISGDSFIVDVRPITGDPSEGFMEVFKYAVKFSDLSLADNWHAAQLLKGKRLLGSFGLFRGVQVPESLLDEPLDSLPYWDRFYRYVGDEYRFTGESPKASDPQDSPLGPCSYEVVPENQRTVTGTPQDKIEKSNQRRAYALTRMSRAVDRQITARVDDEKNKAGLWVMAWARVAKP
jgi:hypothetical protein